MPNSGTNGISGKDWLIVHPMLRVWFQAVPQLLEEISVEQVEHLPLELQQQRQRLNLRQEQQLILTQQLEQSILIDHRQHIMQLLQLHLSETLEQQIQMIHMLCNQHEPLKSRMNWLRHDLHQATEIETLRMDRQTNQLIIQLYETVDYFEPMIQMMLEQHRLIENQLLLQLEHTVIENQQNNQLLLSCLRETAEQKELIILVLIKHHRMMEDQMYQMWNQLNL